MTARAETPARITLLWRLLEGERGRYLAAIACTIGAAVFAYGTPLSLQALLDGVLKTAADEGDRRLAPAAAWLLELLGGEAFVAARLWIVAAFVVATAAISGLCLYGRGSLAAEASQRSIRRLRERLHAHLQRLPSGFFRRSESGDLLQRLTSDVETIQNFLGSQVVEMGRSVALLLAALPLMLLTNATMTAASLVATPVVLVFAVRFFRRVRRTFLLKDEAEGRMTARAQENLTGIRVVRSFDRGAFEEARFREANREHRDLDRRLFGHFALFWSVSDLLCLLQLGGVIALGLSGVARGWLSIGDFAFFLIAVNLWLMPMRMLGRLLADLGKATVAIDRLQEILDEPEEAPPPQPVPRQAFSATPGIEFDRVRFRHGAEGPFALEGISFRIAPGETVALMGPSGSGKSTLLDLLLRLDDPTSGRILIDGVDVADRPREEIRGLVASVLQPPFLFSRSVRDNVAMASRIREESEIVAAAAIAAVHETVASLPGGYATAVGERGITLSGGQRQRLAIARALLRDAPILLLDDALSAVDTETERRILDAMRSRHGRRTTIIVAHRLSTLEAADRVVVLEAGRVAEVGTPAELRGRPGLYRRLWEIQGEVEREAIAGAPPQEKSP